MHTHTSARSHLCVRTVCWLSAKFSLLYIYIFFHLFVLNFVFQHNNSFLTLCIMSSACNACSKLETNGHPNWQQLSIQSTATIKYESIRMWLAWEVGMFADGEKVYVWDWAEKSTKQLPASPSAIAYLAYIFYRSLSRSQLQFFENNNNSTFDFVLQVILIHPLVRTYDAHRMKLYIYLLIQLRTFHGARSSTFCLNKYWSDNNFICLLVYFSFILISISSNACMLYTCPGMVRCFASEYISPSARSPLIWSFQIAVLVASKQLRFILMDNNTDGMHAFFFSFFFSRMHSLCILVVFFYFFNSRLYQ